MKSSFLSLFAAAGLAVALAAPPVFADANHSHGPKHGGVVREIKNITYELVARPDGLTLHVRDHDKPVSTKGAQAEAALYAGSGKTEATLEPAGENRMVAKGNFRTGVGVRAVLTVTLPGQGPVKVNFKLK